MQWCMTSQHNILAPSTNESYLRMQVNLSRHTGASYYSTLLYVLHYFETPHSYLLYHTFISEFARISNLSDYLLWILVNSRSNYVLDLDVLTRTHFGWHKVQRHAVQEIAWWSEDLAVEYNALEVACVRTKMGSMIPILWIHQQGRLKKNQTWKSISIDKWLTPPLITAHSLAYTSLQHASFSWSTLSVEFEISLRLFWSWFRSMSAASTLPSILSILLPVSAIVVSITLRSPGELSICSSITLMFKETQLVSESRS